MPESLENLLEKCRDFFSLQRVLYEKDTIYRWHCGNGKDIVIIGKTPREVLEKYLEINKNGK